MKKKHNIKMPNSANLLDLLLSLYQPVIPTYHCTHVFSHRISNEQMFLNKVAGDLSNKPSNKYS